MDLRDPLNVGSAFRIADATGAKIVLAGTTPTPPNSKINKTARSTVRSVPYQTVVNGMDFLMSKRQEGAHLLALELTDSSSSVLSYELPQDVRDGHREVVLLPGAEAAGVAPELLAQVDAAVHLPMHGQNTSLNVSVAIGAAVYALLGQLQ
ncbi:hypothetical protein A3850_000385 [Lewinella sp. 4G2]|nr:hypothetical protein A3850_000385 [Lewinella sp. 4G2]